MKNISEFKKGDFITRLGPSKPRFKGAHPDRSYMGDKIEFIGIANGMIYFHIHDSIFDSEKLCDLELDLWDESWGEFQDPYALFEIKNPNESTLSLEDQLEEALANEDYKLATKLRNQLKK
jgi:hypothetical protein